MDDQLTSLFKLVKKDIGKDEHGNEKVFKGDDLSMGSVVKYGVPSGIPEMDIFLGCRGGYPAGKIVEFYGKPMCGKTTAALQAAAEWQKRGGGVAFIDTEQSFDPVRATQLGVNAAEVLKTEARTVEDIFTQIKKILDSLGTDEKGFDKPFLIIVDSVNGVPVARDAAGDLEKHEQVGAEAKMIKRGCRQVNSILDTIKAQPTIIFINHAVTKIGVSFGKQTDSGGGLGIKFYSSVRVEFAGTGWEKDKDGARTGQKINVEIVKLKGGQIEYPKFKATLLNKSGFDKRGSLLSAMLVTSFAHRSKGSQINTILGDTAYEVQIKSSEWNDWLVEQGGYDVVYDRWRKWCVSRKILRLWGQTA